MCKALHIKRSVYYYKGKSKQANTELSSAIIHEFYLSRSNYGTRKLKIQLSKKQNEHSAMQVSRRKIGQLMMQYQLDLHNHKIIGSAVRKHKDAQLVKTAFYGVQADLRRIEIFHTDRGSEFKNQIIDEIISTFKINEACQKPEHLLIMPAQNQYTILSKLNLFLRRASQVLMSLS